MNAKLKAYFEGKSTLESAKKDCEKESSWFWGCVNDSAKTICNASAELGYAECVLAWHEGRAKWITQGHCQRFFAAEAVEYATTQFSESPSKKMVRFKKEINYKDPVVV